MLSQWLKNGWIRLGIVLIVISVSYFGYKHFKTINDEKLIAEQKAKAEKVFKPVIQAFDENISINKSQDSIYDIDKTIRVIHEIDQAIVSNDNLEDYLLKISKQDYRNVAPEVLEARKKLLKTTMEIYARQTKLKDQPDYWDLIREYTLAAGSGINPAGLASPIPTDAIKFDPNLSKKTYEEYLESKKVSEEVKSEIRELKTILLKQLYEYSTVYYKYYDEWDRVCLHRDKGYLAVKSGQWDVVENEADIAIRKAPYDKEAHILKGLAMVASMPSIAQPNIHLGEKPILPDNTQVFLDKFIQDNPGYSAPALLLKGVYHLKKGDMKTAKLLFEESAAYYPKQADLLQNNFDPYRMRSYLRKSKEGNQITEMYKTTMLGGGFFTPDLQLAKLYYASNNPEMGKSKVLDHFQRRRNQSQWDYIISDIRFCETAFGKDFQKILPEHHFLQLKVKPTMIGDKLKLSVINHSEKRLSNASLILCIQFTDMMRDDYIALKVDKTLPAILPNEENSFESMEIQYDMFGKMKGVEDIVTVRAIVISDEGVNWVDTEAFKFENMKKQRETLSQLRTEESKKILTDYGFDKETILKIIRNNAKISVSSSKLSLNNVLSINMPKELAFLNPIFRLTEDGNVLIEPSKNQLNSNGIQLDFKLNKLTSEDKSSYTTKMFTQFGEFNITWFKDPKSGQYKIKDVKVN
ncbi:MAG: hypothetical protein JNL75_05250 [Chitinophagales bacterium]|nr:hypothetical protein [Chitinophagales bacterium]